MMPRSAYPLLGLLALALLWLLRPQDGTTDHRIFPVDPASVESLEVSLDAPHPPLTARLRLDDGLWILDGSVSDLTDRESVDGLVASICAQNRSPAQDLPDWRRRASEYGLDRPPVRISLGLRGDDRRILEIGGANPSTGVYYAAFAGSDELFLIKPELAEIALSVLGSVRAMELWPDFEIIEIDTLAISGDGRPAEDLFFRDTRGRWWVSPPVDGSTRFGSLARAYRDLYPDRRRSVDGAVRLNDARVEDFLYLLQQTVVKEFLSLDRTGPDREDPPRVRIAAAGGLSHDVVLGGAEPAERVDAWRDGSAAGMSVSGKALKYVAMPLSGMLHTDAITESVSWSDSLSLRAPDASRIKARRTDDGWRLVRGPDADTSQALDDVLGDFIHYFDTLAIEQVRPPRETPDFLEESTYVLRIWRSAADAPVEEVWIGKLREDRRTGAWFPADGRLVIVPQGAYTFCREYSVMAARAGVR